jgi:hypothetical protein
MSRFFVLMAAVVVSAFLAGCSSAPTKPFTGDKVVEYDGKKIVITDVGVMGGLDKPIHSNEVPDGIFVRASAAEGTPVNGASLQYAEKLIKERFVIRGFKISEQAESASISIQFGSTQNAKFSMAGANNIAEQSDLNKTKLVSGGLLMIGRGSAGVVGGLANILVKSDEKVYFMGLVSEKPKYSKPNYLVSSNKGSDEMGTSVIKYKLFDKDDRAPDDAILKMLVDQWIDQYMVLDAPGVVSAK